MAHALLLFWAIPGKGLGLMHATDGFAEQRGRYLAARIESAAALSSLIDHENTLGQTEVALDNLEALGLKSHTGTNTVTLNAISNARAATERLVEEVETNYNLAALSTFGQIVKGRLVNSLVTESKAHEVVAAVRYLQDPSRSLASTISVQVMKGTDRQTAETYDNVQKVRQGLGILKNLSATYPEAAELLSRYELQTRVEQQVLEAHGLTRKSLSEVAATAELRVESMGKIIDDHLSQLQATGQEIPKAIFSDESLNVALHHAGAVRSSSLIDELGQTLRQTPLHPEAKQVVLNRVYGVSDYLHARQVQEKLFSLQTQDAVDRIEKGEIPADPSLFRSTVDMPAELTVANRPLQQFRGIEGGERQSQFVLEKLTRRESGVSLAEVENTIRFAAAHDTAQSAVDFEKLTNELGREWRLSPTVSLITGPERDYLDHFSPAPAVAAPAEEDVALTAIESAALSL
jgi:hypothetical protein